MTIRPEDHRDEILRLYDEEGYSQAKIIRHFQEKYGELKRSTLSDFLKAQSRNGTAEVLRSEAEPGALAPAMPEAGVEISEQFTALAFGQVMPDHRIDQTILVFEGDESDATGGLRALAHGDQSGESDTAAVGQVTQLRRALAAACAQL